MAQKQPLDYGLVQLACIAAFAGVGMLVYNLTEGAWQVLALPAGVAGAAVVIKLAENMIRDIKDDD